MIAGVAVVPTTPLLLDDIPGRRHPELTTLAAQVRRALHVAGPVDLAVALAGGGRLAVVDAPDTDLSGYGLTALPDHPLDPGPAAVVGTLRHAVARCRAERDSCAAVAEMSEGSGPAAPAGAAGGTMRDATADDVSGGSGHAARSTPDDVSRADRRSRPQTTGEWEDLPVLVHHLPANTPTVGLTAPPDLGAGRAVLLGQAIARVAQDHDVLLVVAGDLGAGHGPKPPRPDAAEATMAFDQQVVAALDNGRAVDLIRLDHDLADRAHARAAGALRILGTVLDQARRGTVVRANAAPLGVGYVVAAG